MQFDFRITFDMNVMDKLMIIFDALTQYNY